jgi:hypothetical protein
MKHEWRRQKNNLHESFVLENIEREDIGRDGSRPLDLWRRDGSRPLDLWRIILNEL